MRRRVKIMKNAASGLVLPVIMLFLVSCSEHETADVRPVRLGVANQPSNALVFIALEKGYFLDAGLEIKPTIYPSGKRALLDGLLEKREDYVTAADVPFARQSFEQADLRTIASLYTADNINRIIARRDRGIEQPSDLAGKTLATQGNSAVHYFLHLFLESEKIDHDHARVMFMKAEDLVPALKEGRIDAFSMRDPFISMAAKVLGDNAVIFSARGLQVQSELLVSRLPVIQQDPVIAERLIHALLMAETFALDNREEAISIVARKIGVERHKIADLWSFIHLEVAMDQSLLLQFEKLADWIVSEMQVAGDKPYFLDHLYLDALKKTSPQSISVVQ